MGRCIEEIISIIVDNVDPGDVVLVMSNGSFGNIHTKPFGCS